MAERIVLIPDGSRCQAIMADEVDHANDLAQQILDSAIAAARKPMVKGEPGECHRCREESLRLINDTCARCRDKYHLP